VSDKNEFLRGAPADAGGEQLIRLAFKGITLLVIFLGVWASTQKFCSLVNYESIWCGSPFHTLRAGEFSYPLYRPFSIFYWLLRSWKYQEIHPYLYRAFHTAAWASGLAIAFYFCMEFILARNKKQNIFGTARWATEKNMKTTPAGRVFAPGAFPGNLTRALGNPPGARRSAALTASHRWPPLTLCARPVV
jgi:type IV secretory pathway TraG/TraD family ATPase VirD4